MKTAVISVLTAPASPSIDVIERSFHDQLCCFLDDVYRFLMPTTINNTGLGGAGGGGELIRLHVRGGNLLFGP